MNRVTILCFLASYLLALVLELIHFWRGQNRYRILAILAAAAGLVAHTLYLIHRQPPLIWQFGWMIFLAWILAIFHLCGAIHYRRMSWGLFVLPVVLGLLAIGLLLGKPPPESVGLWREDLTDLDRLWAPVHASLILLSTVGLCVGFIASLMYLVQAQRIRRKAPPGEGLRLLSLERLEDMNRRALFLSFPLLTAGVIAGGMLLFQGSDTVSWMDIRVIATLVLWVAFAVLLFVRFARNLRGRQVALLTIVAFCLLLLCLVISHPLGAGRPPAP
ncbi:MAG: cytochrome c biogenesis protein CcsA [Gemmataceae bacterium]